MAKSMPQRLRHKLGALDDFAERFVPAGPADMPLASAIARFIRGEIGIEVPVDAFRPESAPPHLHMNFRVVDEHGRQLGMGRDLAELKRALGGGDREDPAGRIASRSASAIPAGPWATFRS